jgi:hypothetical protein
VVSGLIETSFLEGETFAKTRRHAGLDPASIVPQAPQAVDCAVRWTPD